MDLRSIRYFIAVADAGSFSAGAAIAGVTQPTLSAAISDLEAELGIKVFERHNRGIRLTAGGAAALGHAREILRHRVAMQSAGGAIQNAKRLRLGLLSSLPHTAVAKALSRLTSLNAQFRWQSEDADLQSLRRRLATGRYEAILGSLERKSPPGVHQLKLGQDSQVLAVPKSEMPEGRLTPEYLQGRPLIVRTHCEFLQAATRILDAWRVRPFIVAKTTSDSRALQLVAAGCGACLVPSSMSHPDVALLPVEGVELVRTFGLTWIRGAANGLLDDMAA